MEEETIGLTIFLLKPDQVASFEDKILGGQNPLALSEPLDGVFLPLPSTPHQPAWVRAIRSILRSPESLSLPAQSPAGLLVVRRSGRTFVITFGHAWQRLESDWIERDFGKRIALNSIARDKVVEIRAEQVFAKWHLANERAPRASSVDEFGVEFDRDLVGTLEGVPSHPDLGKTLRGGTNLRISLALSQLEGVLDKSKILFESSAYKKIWPEIDNISPVRDQVLIGRLEAQLDSEFQSGQAQRKIVMFTPTHRRDESWAAESYVFGRMSQNPPITPYLTINAWINFLARHQRLPSVAEAKATPVHLLDEAKEEAHTCTAFECFGFELSLDGLQYLVSSGVWYEVVPEFLARINREINRIPVPKISLPAWDQIEGEGAYNVRCSTNKAFLHFDDNAKQILMGGGQSRFEFCDLLRRSVSAKAVENFR